jgi:hypothetical protein
MNSIQSCSPSSETLSLAIAAPRSSLADRRESILSTAWPLVAAIGMSVAGWGIILAAVPPSGQDFPLGDDWAFSHSFIDLAEGKGLNYREFASMPQLGQWLWAWPFYMATHPPLFALRLSSIALGWLGLWALYDLFRQQGLSNRRSGFLTAVMGMNALWFQLQGTFMTDVPALAFSLIALAGYGRAILSQRAWLIPATIAALLGAITRQNCIVVPAVAMYFAWRRERLAGFVWWASLLLPIAAAIGTHVWFMRRPDIFPPVFKPRPPEIALLAPFVILHTCGLLCLPAVALNPRPRSLRLLLGSTLLMFGMAIYWAGNSVLIPSFDKEPYFPYTIPILSPFGPFGGHFQIGMGPTLLPMTLRKILSVAGCIGGAYLLTALVEFIQERRPVGLICSFVGLHLILLFFAPGFYDRYFLVLLPGALLLMGGSAEPLPMPRIQWTTGLILLAGTAVSSVALMHDWLSWNRTRWQMGREALAQGKDPWDIEGGFEWDGWYAPMHRAPPPAAGSYQPHRMVLQFTWEIFTNVRGKYAIGFSRFARTLLDDIWPRVREVRSQEYPLWSCPGKGKLLWLEDPEAEK